MKVSESLHWPTSLHPVVFAIPLNLLLLLLLHHPASGSTGSKYDYGGHPHFICSPLPADMDPTCFPTGGPGGAGGSGPTAQGFHSGPGTPPAGWWRMTEEAKVTILHLRENIIQQKESMLELRETVWELTAKLTLCEGFARGVVEAADHGLRTPYTRDRDLH